MKEVNPATVVVVRWFVFFFPLTFFCSKDLTSASSLSVTIKEGLSPTTLTLSFSPSPKTEGDCLKDNTALLLCSRNQL